MTAAEPGPAHDAAFVSELLRGEIEASLEPAVAFDRFAEELRAGLERHGLSFQPDGAGPIRAGSVEVGRIGVWRAPGHLRLEWTEPRGTAPPERDPDSREAGVPGEHLPLFSAVTRFLLGRSPGGGRPATGTPPPAA